MCMGCMIRTEGEKMMLAGMEMQQRPGGHAASVMATLETAYRTTAAAVEDGRIEEVSDATTGEMVDATENGATATALVVSEMIEVITFALMQSNKARRLVRMIAHNFVIAVLVAESYASDDDDYLPMDAFRDQLQAQIEGLGREESREGRLQAKHALREHVRAGIEANAAQLAERGYIDDDDSPSIGDIEDMAAEVDKLLGDIFKANGEEA